MLRVTFITKQKLSLDLKIYPNPFTNKTVIEFPNSGFENYQLIVTNISGMIVKIIADITDNKIELTRGNLTKGFYLVELRGTKIYRGKILIE